jgi:GNAT superfamily N-acetyltransferase
VIRLAEYSDAREIAEVLVNTWKTTYSDIVPESHIESLNVDKFEDIFKDNIKNKKEIIVVDVQNDIITGFASGSKDRSEKYDCELIAIYILKEYQGLRIGKNLILNLMKKHYNNKCNSMITWVLDTNNSKYFYEKMGAKSKEEKYTIFDNVKVKTIGYVWENIGVAIQSNCA